MKSLLVSLRWIKNKQLQLLYVKSSDDDELIK